MIDQQIPDKTNRVLNVILLGFLLILIRVWYLTVAQQEEYVLRAHKPQRRSVTEHVERATIRDRFNIPLALNKIQYNAAVCYADIRQIPTTIWKKNAEGKPIRFAARLNYIKELAAKLAEELELDPLRIEDAIHGKASLFPHTPFIVKEEISEKQYYRLRMLEKEWLGLSTQRTFKRFYPQGKIGCDLIGYMGAISQQQHLRIATEIRELEHYLAERESGEMTFLPKGFHTPLEVRERLRELQEKSYTINDLVGKTGVEAAFDEQLRGFYGKKIYEVDMKGNFLRELPGSRPSTPGRRILLSISSELQEFAEKLLATHELSQKKEEDTPWIKGGAIVAMIPQTGEVLTLASHPRFDPNDFIPAKDPKLRKKKYASVSRWLENPSYIADIWDGKCPLSKECFSFIKGEFYEEELALTWQNYLKMILPEKSALLQSMQKITTLKDACLLQDSFVTLLHLSKQSDARALMDALYPEAPSRAKTASATKVQLRETLNEELDFRRHKRELDAFLGAVPHNDDKLLALDLCRLLVFRERFSPPLLEELGQISLTTYQKHVQALQALQEILYPHIQELYHEIDFAAWREQHFKEFLKVKREEERERKLYPKPYTDYLDKLEKSSFKEFWEQNRLIFLQALLQGDWKELAAEHPNLEPYLSSLPALEPAPPELDILQETLANLSPPLILPYLATMRSFEELDRALLGRYRGLRELPGKQLEKHLAASFYPLSGFGYSRSEAFRQSTPQGSVFKLVTAYEALKKRYEEISSTGSRATYLNPLTLIDEMQGNAPSGSDKQILGYTMDHHPIPRMYKGGLLPRGHPGIGKVDIVSAMEQSSNLYFSLLAGDYIEDPLRLIQAARSFGFGARTGIELPGEIAGFLPEDLSHNRTGLYAFAIGQHSLVVTPLQTAVMLSTIANQGLVLKPQVVQVMAGKEPSREQERLFSATRFPFEEPLSLVGLNFSLFTEVGNDQERAYVTYSPTAVKRQLFLPPEIRNQLLEGMQRVVLGPKGNARPNTIQRNPDNPEAVRTYQNLKEQIIGKTGTAEIRYKQTIDATSSAVMKKHTWFGAISFKEDAPYGEPELVVVVYLRFGKSGKNAAPIAAQIVKKWREICEKHGQTSHVVTQNAER